MVEMILESKFALQTQIEETFQAASAAVFPRCVQRNSEIEAVGFQCEGISHIVSISPPYSSSFYLTVLMIELLQQHLHLKLTLSIPPRHPHL